METIIGLLFILLPVIFKLIGRKFEQSGQTEKTGKVRELAKTLDVEDETEENPFEELRLPPVSQPVEVAFQQQPIEEDVKRTTTRNLLQEAAPQKKNREKIDPKKLVIYSEIMEPKYKQ